MSTVLSQTYRAEASSMKASNSAKKFLTPWKSPPSPCSACKATTELGRPVVDDDDNDRATKPCASRGAVVVTAISTKVLKLHLP